MNTVDQASLSKTNIAPPATGITAHASGTGPALVLVHGALGDLRQWDAMAAFLNGRTVIALSRRFHWPNPAPSLDADYTVQSHCQDLLALLRSTGHPVDLAGHSYGALVVLAAALKEPGLVRSLALFEPPLGSLISPAPELEVEHASRAAMLASLRARVASGEHELAAAALVDWVQEHAGGIASLPAQERKRLRDNAATIGPTYAAAPPAVDCMQLRTLAMPVLIVNGERTRPFYLRAAHAAAACIAQAETALVRNAGHMLIIEQPATVATLLRRFLERVEGACLVDPV